MSIYCNSGPFPDWLNDAMISAGIATHMQDLLTNEYTIASEDGEELSFTMDEVNSPRYARIKDWLERKATAKQQIREGFQ
jgi:hypothetical protein